MKTINHETFMKNVFMKGSFEQFIVSPYSGEPTSGGRYNQIVLISNKVSEPTFYTHRKQKLSLILPATYKLGAREVMAEHYDIICEYMGVLSPYFTVYELDYNRRLFSVSQPAETEVC